MAVRTLSQIISELNKADAPQIRSLQKQRSLIPQRIATEEKGLQARQEQAFGDILGGARRRGLGFSGIPLSEQAQYTSTEFLPALARLRQQGATERMSLQDAILGIRSGNSKLAQSLRQGDLDRAEQIRQFNASLAEQRAARAAASRAASSSSFGPSLGDIFGGGGGKQTIGSMTVKKSPLGSGRFPGYAFTNAKKQPISAATYASLNKIPIGTLLKQMAEAGDVTAANAYKWVQYNKGSEFANSGGLQKALPKKYPSLFWGIK